VLVRIGDYVFVALANVFKRECKVSHGLGPLIDSRGIIPASGPGWLCRSGARSRP
jgi:hypothetical protein